MSEAAADALDFEDEFPDYADVVPPLVLRGNGKRYTIPPVSASDGVVLALSAEGNDAAGKKLAKMTLAKFEEIFLGPTRAQMVRDGQSPGFIKRAFNTALADYRFGRQSAKATWRAGEAPEFQAALQAAAVLATTNSKTSTDTESDQKTPSPASTEATTSPTAIPSPVVKPSKATRSNGRRSSSSGSTSATTS